MTHVLVTGASGYVGSRLARVLAARPGTTVRALTRRPIPHLGDIEQVQVFDLSTDDRGLEKACAGADAVVHLAGANEVDAAADPDGSLATTVAGTRHVAAAAVRSGVARFVYLSTVHVYGAALVEGAVITEETLPAPRHPYALARLASEHTAAATAGLDLVVFRLTNAVGAPADPSVRRWTLVANELCREAATTGSLTLKTPGLQWRDFVALGDVCTIVSASVEATALPAGTYNLGAGSPMTIRHLATLVQDAFEAQTGRRPPLTAPEPPSRSPQAYTVSVDRVAGHGFSASTPVAAAVAETAAFCLAHMDEL